MKLKNNNIDICLWSDNYEPLARWYQDTFELTEDAHLHYPDDTGIGFQLGGNYLYIGQHDQVHGQAKDPYRIMISFYVDSVKQSYQELSDKGVEFIAEPFPAPPGGFWCATLKDPEGNILQLTGDE